MPPWLAELNQKRQRQAVAVPPTPPPAAAAKPISSTPQPTPPPRPVRPEPPSGVKGLAEEEAGAATRQEALDLIQEVQGTALDHSEVQ